MTSQTLPPQAAAYLADLESAVTDLPSGIGDDLIADIRAHLAEAMAADRPIEEVLRSLGPADQVVAEVRDSLGLGATADAGPWLSEEAIAAEAHARKVSRSRTGLSIAAAALGLVTALLASVVAPRFAPGGILPPLGARATEPLGMVLAAIILLPTLVATVPLLVPLRHRELATLGAAMVLTAFAASSSLLPAIPGIVTLWLPMLLMAWAAVIIPWRLQRRAGGAPHPGWRISGAMVLAVPGIIGAHTLATGSARPDAGIVGVVCVILVLAALYGLGVRVVQPVVATAGALTLVANAAVGPWSSPLFWLLGGVWLVVGLGAIASNGWRARTPS